MIKNLKNKLSVAYLQQIVESKGYKFFTKDDWNVNIIGVRGPVKEANKFDDTMLIAYKDRGQWFLKEWKITTDAGTYWLENPMNSKGTAILVPGQYRSVYKIDRHLGKYDALCQRGGEVSVYRDNNKDKILDMNDATVDKGYFGINIHRSNPYSESHLVNKWSAGCQVFQAVSDFNEFMLICDRAKGIWGNSFTYTLLEEKDLNL